MQDNAAVIIGAVIFIGAFLFYCLLYNHSFPTNPNSITYIFKLVLSIIQSLFHYNVQNNTNNANNVQSDGRRKTNSKVSKTVKSRTKRKNFSKDSRKKKKMKI